MGLGETLEDRVDMVFTVKELGVKSVPVNFLNPIPGTPYENNRPLTEEEARQCVAVFRFIIPDASIRLAGGRGLLSDKGRECFQSGANAAISGDMLTTAGITVQKDMDMLKELGYRPELRVGLIMAKKLFITGTGTDIGKTYVTGLILKENSGKAVTVQLTTRRR